MYWGMAPVFLYGFNCITVHIWTLAPEAVSYVLLMLLCSKADLGMFELFLKPEPKLNAIAATFLLNLEDHFILKGDSCIH